MTLEDLWEVARANLPEQGTHWAVSHYVDWNGYSTAAVHVHRADGTGIERSIYATGAPGGDHASALELAALAVVENRWEWAPAPLPPVSPQEAA